MSVETLSRICDICDIEHEIELFTEPDPHVCDICKGSGIEIPAPSQRFLSELAEKQAQAAYVSDIHATLAKRTLSRRRLLQFVTSFRPKYTAGWVHTDIARRLERFMEQVAAKKSPRLLICMPPRSGKSELTSRNFPAWMLGHHPEWEIIAASHTQSLAMSFSRYIRDTLRDPAYSAIFPETKLDPDSQSVENWNTTAGGGYMAAGVGTGITGRGAHCLIIDDPVKDMEAADSKTIRDGTWEWYLSTAYTRLAPGGGVLGILTLWNEDDWGGRVILDSESGEGDSFEIVRYPAINDAGDEYLLQDDRVVQLPQDATPPEGATLIRPRNTALHPERYDLEYLERIKKAYYATGNQRIWSALYQQNPTPDEGTFFTKELFQFGQFERRREYNVYQAWDFAITEKSLSDWTVCATLMQTPEDDLVLVDITRFKSADGVGIVDAILDNYAQWKADFVGVEDGQIWKSLASLFTRRAQERRLYPSIDVLTPLTDKMVRAGPLRGRMQMKKFFVQANAPWRRDWESEMLHFPAGKHDDQCLVAGTLITMADGEQRRIEAVRVGEKVLTPGGPCLVSAAGMTSADAEVFAVAGLIGTGGHPVWTGTRGWARLDSLTLSDTIHVMTSQEARVANRLERGARPSTVSVRPDFEQNLARTDAGIGVTLITQLPSALSGKRPVYNLTVEGEHCYYANGVLVHNCDACAWAVRLALQHRPQHTPRPKAVKSWKDKLRVHSPSGAGHMAA